MDVQFFVQVRLGSARFPGKVLAPVCADTTMLDVIDRRIRRSRYFQPGNVLYLTTTDPTDDALVRFFDERGWEYRRGDVENVFSRFRAACAERRPEAFFRVCADNPFLDPGLIDQLADSYRDTPSDYTSFVDPAGLPVIRTHYGIFAELIRVQTFMDLDPDAVDAATRRDVTPLFYTDRERFNAQLIPMPEHLVNVRMRLTVDTESDLAIVSEIIGETGLDATIEDVYQYVEQSPQLLAAMARQKSKNEKT